MGAVLLIQLAVGAGCGGGGNDGVKIALLVPGNQVSRNESVIEVNFGQRLLETCGVCSIVYADAGGRISAQRRQAEAALSKGATVLVLNPVDPQRAAPIVEEAKGRDVPVINYGRLIADSEPDVYVSFDDTKNGEVQAAALSRKLEEEGRAGGSIVMLEGEPGNRNENVLLGARREFRSAGVDIAGQYSIPLSDAGHAQGRMHDAIATLGDDGFDGVYAETDEIAKGAIAAMRSAGIDPAERPTTGRGSTLAGLQRILAGQQYMTVYEPVESEASVSAQVAVDLEEGNGIPQGKVPAENETQTTAELDHGTGGVPSILIEPIAVTKPTIKRLLIADGLFSASELCLTPYRRACRAAGISD